LRLNRQKQKEKTNRSRSVAARQAIVRDLQTDPSEEK